MEPCSVQYEDKVRSCVAVHISLNNRVAAAFKPSNAVRHNVLILKLDESERLISVGSRRSIRVNSRQVDYVLSMYMKSVMRSDALGALSVVAVYTK